jgi:hypothetical protein
MEKQTEKNETYNKEHGVRQLSWRNSVRCKFNANGTCLRGRECLYSHDFSLPLHEPKPIEKPDKFAHCGYHGKRRHKAHLNWDKESQTWNCNADDPDSICIKHHSENYGSSVQSREIQHQQQPQEHNKDDSLLKAPASPKKSERPEPIPPARELPPPVKRPDSARRSENIPNSQANESKESRSRSPTAASVRGRSPAPKAEASRPAVGSRRSPNRRRVRVRKAKETQHRPSPPKENAPSASLSSYYSDEESAAREQESSVMLRNRKLYSHQCSNNGRMANVASGSLISLRLVR